MAPPRERKLTPKPLLKPRAQRTAHSPESVASNNRAAAARIVRAIESLLPNDAKFKEGYALGYKDGTEDTLKKTKRDDSTPRSR